MYLLDTVTGDVAALIREAFEAAVRRGHESSAYLGRYGAGDRQSAEYALERIPEDFEYQHLYGFVYGVIMGSGMGDPWSAQEDAETVVDLFEMAQNGEALQHLQTRAASLLENEDY